MYFKRLSKSVEGHSKQWEWQSNIEVLERIYTLQIDVNNQACVWMQDIYSYFGLWKLAVVCLKESHVSLRNLRSEFES